MKSTDSIRRQRSRRDFLQQSGAAVAGVVAGVNAMGLSIPAVHAAEDHTLRIALVGCGGRGSGAGIDAVAAAAQVKLGPVKIYALADVFENRLRGTADAYADQIPDQFDCPVERQFAGFDGYREAIDSLRPGDLVLLATPPTFRPMHVEYAVSRGVNVFMEKSFAVDPPGVRRMLRNGKAATEKNLKVAGGLMSRHSIPLQECIGRIHDGIIGDVTTIRAYREHDMVGFSPRAEGESELAHQIRNYSNFTWVNGSFMLDWLIHNLDVSCWTKGMWPVSAQGQGGRASRTVKDQLFDHYSVEYRFDDGTTLIAQGRHQPHSWGFFGDIVVGTKGCAVLGEGIGNPQIFKGWKMTSENLIWEHKGEFNPQYRTEHEVLQRAIREDRPHNETEHCCWATMTGLLGLAASESGMEETWDGLLAAEKSLADVDALTSFDSPAPVTADADGNYPIAIPGVTRTFQ